MRNIPKIKKKKKLNGSIKKSPFPEKEEIIGYFRAANLYNATIYVILSEEEKEEMNHEIIT